MPIAIVYRLTREECTSPRESPEAFVAEALHFIKKHVKPEDRVLSMISGGVDSSVVVALLDKSVGNRLYCTHVDTGFMRLINGEEEPQIVDRRFEGLKKFELLDGRELFYRKVMGIPDAEHKRLGFRSGYEEVTSEQARKHECIVMSQGTIYPDIIETEKPSEGGFKEPVKSQHNVDITIEGVEKVIEPLAGLYKDEVRLVARYLWETQRIPYLEGIKTRQPFPGPGLSVRTVGVITPEKLEVERVADDITEQMIRRYMRKAYGTDMYIDPSGEQIPFMSFAATFDNRTVETPPETQRILEEYGIRFSYLLDANTTGVQDGRRVYSHPICVRTDSQDYDELIRMGTEIPARTDTSRVLYEIIRDSDDSQYSVSIHSIRSRDTTTAGVFEVPLPVLSGIAEKIVEECRVAAVYWNISGKPPATMECE